MPLSDDGNIPASPGRKPSLPRRIADGLRKRARKITAKVAEQFELHFARFKVEEKEIEFPIDITHGTVWATERQIADLFGIDQRTVSEHVKNIFGDNELTLSEATYRKIRSVRDEGGRLVERDLNHYSLKVILAVGYRTSSPRAIEFRGWATRTLEAYVTDGYVLNERRLRDDPAALKDLAARVRALRNDEKNIYTAVRECFRAAAVDYDPGSQAAKSFYAKLQDKFLYAVSEQTASEIVIGRADGERPNMGLTSMKGSFPTFQDAKVGKNYLDQDELHILHILGEQFLLYAESKAFRGQPVTMAQLLRKLDELLTTNEYPVLSGYGPEYLRGKADTHARAELERFKGRTRAGEAGSIPPPGPRLPPSDGRAPPVP